jgi:hypothetical protein
MGNTNRNTAREWPESALAAAANAFDMLVAPPAALSALKLHRCDVIA